jgi:hypothetical protein
MSSAPYISPEASPAEIRIRTQSIVLGDTAFERMNEHMGTAARWLCDRLEESIKLLRRGPCVYLDIFAVK